MDSFKLNLYDESKYIGTIYTFQEPDANPEADGSYSIFSDDVWMPSIAFQAFLKYGYFKIPFIDHEIDLESYNGRVFKDLMLARESLFDLYAIVDLLKSDKSEKLLEVLLDNLFFRISKREEFKEESEKLLQDLDFVLSDNSSVSKLIHNLSKKYPLDITTTFIEDVESF